METGHTAKQPKRKKGKRIMQIFGILVLITVIFLLIGTLLHATFFTSKKDQIKPYGQLVPVYDGYMHLTSMGSGDQTIVLLPGMGVGLPSADFAPLMRKLSEKYTVVIVEYFGVGFSSTTAIPRTTAQYVQEIRKSLSEAGFKAPYVLMPHSISSVYSEYYAAKYPQEVKAIISLDGTSTAFYAKMPAIVKAVLPIASFQQAVGTTSILAVLTTNTKKLLSYGYTEKEIKDMVTFAGFTINDTFLQQISESAEFVGQTKDLPFPPSIPYFKIISKKTYETPNKQLPMSPQEYQEQHLSRIGKQAQYEILDGSHFIYLTNIERISEITDEFLSEKAIAKY
ncbi:putative hydrolase or acyltransferase of alpha/beta superfamily [Sphaerochaeta pleomorpha str. Grapes]|uniref:Putative hydrolase or acyltransferase of alpha/beta superfamily n=1 Tax=Sphaerochaeta pleomorpha (strain ATCC BAA-1885 / DSM 22778 / Grapes) TaxID=158190 RepID=G8QUD5_SPHPG|nr:alpha/beta hydrolase [Sphaerochaeta pleomorpha]AEV28105.1 putative hydrolase or acyltransferase of alpha/beta superfamily [Sphaerochaeta pleomorpha str. Grapes]